MESSNTKFTSESIAEFWSENPCGSHFINKEEWEDFFKSYDDFKYTIEPHIPEELRKIDFKNKRVLEIGLGQGAESQKIIEAGAVYNGIDLTAESVKRVKLRCDLFNLPYESIRVMNAEDLSFPESSFDIVFSHGVIHHSPEIKKIIDNIYTVLKPGGMIIIMVYHKNSINYHLSIKVLRRIGIFLLFMPGALKLVSRLTGENIDRLNKHKLNLKRDGIKYLKMKNFLHKSTDGPDNIFSSAFTVKDANMLFKKFKDLQFSMHLFNERHFPVVKNFLSSSMKKRIASKYGWHLWIKGIK